MLITARTRWMTLDVNLNPWNDDRLGDVGSLMNDAHQCVANDFYGHIISKVTYMQQ